MKIVVLTGYYYPNMYPPAACIDKYIQELKKKSYSSYCMSEIGL